MIQGFRKIGVLLFLGLVLLLSPGRSAFALGQKIYDDANILQDVEIQQLESLASQLGAEVDTDFIILTTTSDTDVEVYTRDFYEERQPGYDHPKGSAVILTINLQARDVYLESFGKAYDYLTSGRLTSIRETITPYLSDGEYYQAFRIFLNESHDYLLDPPESLFGQLWFQIVVSVVVGALVVGIMALNAGGKVTVNQATYLNQKTSRVLRSRDDYIRTTVTKRKKPSNSGSSSGFRGGSSHSSRGKF